MKNNAMHRMHLPTQSNTNTGSTIMNYTMRNAQCTTKDQVVGSDLETNGAKEAKEGAVVTIIISVPVFKFFLFITMIVTTSRLRCFLHF